MPVAQMTPAQAVTDVRSATAHDADQQVTDVQITAELTREYKRVRRWLSSFLPELYQTFIYGVLPAGTLADGITNIITKPDNFERLIRLELQLSQNYWQPLAMRPLLHASEGIPRDVGGTYRLTYVMRPLDGDTSYVVPEGCEDIIVNLVAAWVKQRHEEDPSYFVGRAAQLKQELRSDLSMRNGAHARSLMVAAYNNAWVGSFVENLSTFTIW